MQVIEQPQFTRMTESEYLAFEAKSDIKHEFVRGRVYAMTGGTLNHRIITVNTSTQLNVQLSDKDCTVSSPDLRVHVLGKHSYRYPDVTVFCGMPVFHEDLANTIVNPNIMIEVLSASSVITDYNQKLEEYTNIDTLQDYLIISQHTAKIERYSRSVSGEWIYTFVTGLDASLTVASIGCTLDLSKVYQKVDFEAGNEV